MQFKVYYQIDLFLAFCYFALHTHKERKRQRKRERELRHSMDSTADLPLAL